MTNSISTRLASIHILILDNSIQVTALLRNTLLQSGFTSVFTANNGFQGVRILKEERINLIISDWELKASQEVKSSEDDAFLHADILPATGVDFVRGLRQSPHSPTAYVPVIMFTNAAEGVQAASARDAGVDEICSKPIHARQFYEKMNMLFEKPRIFIMADTYKGPCRRDKTLSLVPGKTERRKRKIQIVKHDESHQEKMHMNQETDGDNVTYAHYEPEPALRTLIGKFIHLSDIFTQEKIDACQKLIDDAKALFFEISLPDIAIITNDLIKGKSSSNNRQEICKILFQPVSNIKGQAEIFGFPLIARICNYLIEYCEESYHSQNMTMKDIFIITKLEEALLRAFHQKIVDSDGAMEKELVSIIEQARKQ